MDDKTNLPSRSGAINLPMNGAVESVARAFNQRLTMPEAIEAVGAMLRGYPNAKVQDSYIGTVAALLCEYPKTTAISCTDPLHGIATKTKFVPTIAELVAWLEPNQRHMAWSVEFERRSREQLREREKMATADRHEPSEIRREVAERILAECRAYGMRFADDPKPHTETIEVVKKKYGISDADWDAMPDLPRNEDFWQGVRRKG